MPDLITEKAKSLLAKHDKKPATPETAKIAVSANWVASKVNSAKGVTGGRVDRFFNGMTDMAARTGNKAQAASMLGRSSAVLPQVSDKAMTAAHQATYHPKFPMGKLGSAKEAGLKETLLTEIPGTKPWLLGKGGLMAAPVKPMARTGAKLRSGMNATRSANGAWDVSRQAEQMGLHKASSAFGAALEEIIQEKLAGKFHDFLEGAGHEAGPAAGATIGAGLAKMTGIDPLAGAAAGYGLGATPEIFRAGKAKMLARRAAKAAV